MDSRIKRAIYRAHHRGTKEMDFILGRFADAQIAGFGEAELAKFEMLLALPDPDIERWVKGEEPPPGFKSMIRRIRRHHGLNSDHA